MPCASETCREWADCRVGATGDPGGAGVEGTRREAGSGDGFVDGTVLDDGPADDELVLLDPKAPRSRPKTDLGLDDDLSPEAIAQQVTSSAGVLGPLGRRWGGRTLEAGRGGRRCPLPSAQAVQGGASDRHEDSGAQRNRFRHIVFSADKHASFGLMPPKFSSGSVRPQFCRTLNLNFVPQRTGSRTLNLNLQFSKVQVHKSPVQVRTWFEL
jgi:hypothetical protein